jgi:hypothetical protein
MRDAVSLSIFFPGETTSLDHPFLERTGENTELHADVARVKWHRMIHLDHRANCRTRAGVVIADRDRQRIVADHPDRRQLRRRGHGAIKTCCQ